ncbi:MAG: hypothetical protein IT518_29150 [Burkholderiales bacterium]|nr:hypothetical protein [Burkholderiales bacterium]
MTLRFRILGLLIVACGAVLCHGAVTIWPADPLGHAPVEHAIVPLLRIVGAIVLALIGLLNVVAGAAISVLKPALE